MADDVLKRAYEFYISQGLKPHQAAAMASQMMAESGGHPTIQETKADGTPGPGYGAFQWTTPSRRAGLDAFAKDRPWIDPKSLEGQLAYSMHELDNDEKGPGAKVYGAQTYKEAVDAATDYTRPSGYTPSNPSGAHNYAGRYNFGAGLAGVAPIEAPPPQMPPPQQVVGGLLGAGPAGVDPAAGARIEDEIAAWSKYGSGSGLNYAAGGAMLGKLGAEGMKPPPPQQFQQLHESANEPKQMAPMPNFVEQLAQSRLKRKPWEMG